MGKTSPVTIVILVVIAIAAVIVFGFIGKSRSSVTTYVSYETPTSIYRDPYVPIVDKTTTAVHHKPPPRVIPAKKTVVVHHKRPKPTTVVHHKSPPRVIHHVPAKKQVIVHHKGKRPQSRPKRVQRVVHKRSKAGRRGRGRK